MVAVQQGRASRVNVLWLAVGLALLAALSYVLMGPGVLGVGDLDTSEAPAAITYVAAGGYLLGGLLILLRRRWLWIVGAVINALVVLSGDAPMTGGYARGLARWKLPEGDFGYIECAITELDYTR